jgi:hypothetical protein
VNYQPVDSTGPSLSINSHSNGQTVSNSTITLFGTASDFGQGDNGISSVRVNGVGASGGTASGSGTANWSRTFTLNQGANNITVVARDNSSSQNSTTQSITVNYQPVQDYTIAVSASPSAGGIVGGDGIFIAGSSRTVTAIANSGYSFTNWTENNSVVSTSASYPFTLNGNRTLVANFTLTPGTNVALASNGGVASASSTTPDGGGNFSPSVAIDGDRKGLNNSFWRDGTDVYPDWLQVDFAGNKTINEIDVYTLQDNYTNPTDPTSNLTFSFFGITAFDAQYWNGSAWVTVPGGSVTGNNSVWRKFIFADISTSKIRVLVNNALFSRSRIVELEAYGFPVPTLAMNVALASNGGLASASSTTPDGGGNFSPSVAIDGDRKGLNNSFWRDGTADVYPDWLQVDFAGNKTINEIDVYTAQDNYANPTDPTSNLTFGFFGITIFDVQYWNDVFGWVTVPGGGVAGNNNVWRKFTFPDITTSKIRVLVNNALFSHSRIVELEAYGVPVPTSAVNVALAANGGVASASSTTLDGGGNFSPSVAIDGDRKGLNNSFWRDGTDVYPRLVAGGLCGQQDNQ